MRRSALLVLGLMVVAVALVGVLAGCSGSAGTQNPAGASADSFVGKWSISDARSIQMGTLEFFKDGTYKFPNGLTGTYRVVSQEGAPALDMGGMKFFYKFEGDTLLFGTDKTTLDSFPSFRLTKQ